MRSTRRIQRPPCVAWCGRSTCLHVVIKTAGAVIRARRMQDQLIPGGFDYVLDELATVLEPEIYIRENFPSMNSIYEKRRARTSTKKRNKRVYR